MEYEKLIRERYSVRKFRPEHLNKADLDVILNAGRVAPTAVNGQPQRILVINTDEACEKLSGCEASQSHAPCALLVCCDETKCWTRKFDGRKSGEIDASIVATHMMLAAENMGVGCVWVMVFDPEKTRKAYNIPDEYVPVAFLMLGYPADDAEPSTRHAERLPLEETVFYGEF